MAVYLQDVWWPSLALSPYATVFLLLIVGIWFIPFAEEIALVTAGYTYYTGEAQLLILLSIAGTGVFVGDFLGFMVGRRWSSGRLRHAPALFGNPRWLGKVSVWVDRHGVRALFLTRFLPGVRLPTHVLVGAHGMPFGTYLRVCALAVAVYVPIVFALAYSFGEEIDGAIAYIKHLGNTAWMIVAVVLAIWLIVKLWLARSTGAERAQTDGRGAE